MSSDAGHRMSALGKLLVDLPRVQKRLLIVLSDLVILAALLWLITSLRYGEPYVPTTLAGLVALAIGPVITVGVFAWLGLYKVVTRFIGYRGSWHMVSCVLLSVLIWALLLFMIGQFGMPRSIILAYAVLGSVAVVVTRQIAGYALRTTGVHVPRLPLEAGAGTVVIHGAGRLGKQVLDDLRRTREREVAGFVDNSQSLRGQFIDGVKVHGPDKLPSLMRRFDVREVLLALDDDRRSERSGILRHYASLPIKVSVLPALSAIASGRISVRDARPVDAADLLGRERILPLPELISRSIAGKSVMVTGAGGTIGSELVRQVLSNKPRRVVLFDLSEAALYEIDAEVRERAGALPPGEAPEIVSVLGSVLDAAVVRDTLRRLEVQTLYHAAAYKHIPIMQQNPVVGLNNNTFGTAVLADVARAEQVERFVLISTDKAVRPSNVLGASKRLAEHIVLAHAAEQSDTIFTTVRFGNVLDSSGSVVRRFRRQIESGGPVTVTHPGIVRYFMSISEAAELVLQAGSMARGGEVFVLDMGEAVKIDALARSMIHLMGLELRTPDNPYGQIEIVYTGLRPGDKMSEELFLSHDAVGTDHPRILRAYDPFIGMAELKKELQALRTAMSAFDVPAIQAILLRTVEGYKPDLQAVIAEAPAPTGPPPSRTLH